MWRSEKLAVRARSRALDDAHARRRSRFERPRSRHIMDTRKSGLLRLDEPRTLTSIPHGEEGRRMSRWWWVAGEALFAPRAMGLSPRRRSRTPASMSNWRTQLRTADSVKSRSPETLPIERGPSLTSLTVWSLLTRWLRKFASLPRVGLVVTSDGHHRLLSGVHQSAPTGARPPPDRGELDPIKLVASSITAAQRRSKGRTPAPPARQRLPAVRLPVRDARPSHHRSGDIALPIRRVSAQLVVVVEILCSPSIFPTAAARPTTPSYDRSVPGRDDPRSIAHPASISECASRPRAL